MSEWLRRQTWNLLGYARAGSIPAVDAYIFFQLVYSFSVCAISTSFSISASYRCVRTVHKCSHHPCTHVHVRRLDSEPLQGFLPSFRKAPGMRNKRTMVICYALSSHISIDVRMWRNRCSLLRVGRFRAVWKSNKGCLLLPRRLKTLIYPLQGTCPDSLLPELLSSVPTYSLRKRSKRFYIFL